MLFDALSLLSRRLVVAGLAEGRNWARPHERRAVPLINKLKYSE